MLYNKKSKKKKNIVDLFFNNYFIHVNFNQNEC